MASNPFLPKNTAIRWRAGKVKGTEGIPALRDEPPVPAAEARPSYKKDPRGRKPKDPSATRKAPKPVSVDPPRMFPHAGKMSLETGPFLSDNNTHWGANLDMLALAHGPVGCGVFTQTTRLNLPEFVQGIESFTALHACTGLTDSDLDDAGDAKLAKALDEMRALFPLARGATILSEDPVAMIDANINGIAKTKAREWGKPIIPLRRLHGFNQIAAEAAALKTLAKHFSPAPKKDLDVAIPYRREATCLVWIVAKLLHDCGLNTVHEFTGSSTSDMARLQTCKLVIGFAEQLDVPADHRPGGYAQHLKRWYGTPLLWTCFLGPTATDASLRAIASQFGPRVQKRAEQVIAENRKKVETVIARYRPSLQGKLVLVFDDLPETQLESFHLLGMRVGNFFGWPGKTGVPRRPRLSCNWHDPSMKSLNSYIEEAKPDIVFHCRRDEYDWRKLGLPGLAFTPFFDSVNNFFWGYDGFALFAAALDRAVNAPWRKLLKPPWPEANG